MYVYIFFLKTIDEFFFYVNSAIFCNKLYILSKKTMFTPHYNEHLIFSYKPHCVII